MNDGSPVKIVWSSNDKKGAGSQGCGAEDVLFRSLATSMTGSTSWVAHAVGPTRTTSLEQNTSVSVKPKGNV